MNKLHSDKMKSSAQAVRETQQSTLRAKLAQVEQAAVARGGEPAKVRAALQAEMAKVRA